MSFAGQVVHVFAKDLRRFWPGLAGLGVIMLYHRFVGLPPLGAYGMPFGIALKVFPLLFAVFAAAVIQDDPITSRDAALWQTSPLSGSAVLAAKGLFIGLFLGVVPVVMHVQWIVQLAGGGNVPGLLVDSMLYQGGLIAVAALGAAVTPNLGAFLVLGVGAWVGMQASEIAVRSGSVDFWTAGYDWMWREYAACGVAVGLSVPLLVYHYTARHVARTVAMTVVAVAVGGVALSTVTFDRPFDPRVPTERYAYSDAEGLEFRVATLGLVSRTTPRAASDVWVSAAVIPESTAGVILSPAANRSRLTGSFGEVTADFTERDYRYAGGTMPVARGLPGVRAVGPFSSGVDLATPMLLPLARGSFDDIEALQSTSSLETTVSIDAFEPYILADIPLVEGTAVDVQGSRVTIESVVPGAGELYVEFRVRRATRSLEVVGIPGLTTRGASLALYNADRNEYLSQSNGGSGSGGAPFFMPANDLVGGTRFYDSRVSLTFSLRASDDLTPSDASDRLPDDWFQMASLVLLDAKYRGTFDRTFVRQVPEWPVEGRFVKIDDSPLPEGER
jgi:hypothetical protein